MVSEFQLFIMKKKLHVYVLQTFYIFVFSGVFLSCHTSGTNSISVQQNIEFCVNNIFFGFRIELVNQLMESSHVLFLPIN